MALRVTGGRTVRADRETVWAALYDPDCLRLCVPGCQALTRVSATIFELSVLVPLGPVSAAFDGAIETYDVVPFERLCLRGRGGGGVAGRAGGTARIVLTDVPSGCHLAFVVDVEPSGPNALVGTMLAGGLATTLIETFGTSFAAIVGRPVLPQRDGRSHATPERPTS